MNVELLDCTIAGYSSRINLYTTKIDELKKKRIELANVCHESFKQMNTDLLIMDSSFDEISHALTAELTSSVCELDVLVDRHKQLSIDRVSIISERQSEIDECNRNIDDLRDDRTRRLSDILSSLLESCSISVIYVIICFGDIFVRQ